MYVLWQPCLVIYREQSPSGVKNEKLAAQHNLTFTGIMRRRASNKVSAIVFGLNFFLNLIFF